MLGIFVVMAVVCESEGTTEGTWEGLGGVTLVDWSGGLGSMELGTDSRLRSSAMVGSGKMRRRKESRKEKDGG